MKLRLALLALLLFPVVSFAADDGLQQALAEFSGGGKLSFDAKQGEAVWTKKGDEVDGKVRTCNSCHNLDHTKPGKHAKTGKPIDPMSRTVTHDRFTDLKKINKWLKRNCKWTFGRECTDQEKGDVLTYLSHV